jgi:hypothetical protein
MQMKSHLEFYRGFMQHVFEKTKKKKKKKTGGYTFTSIAL